MLSLRKLVAIAACMSLIASTSATVPATSDQGRRYLRSQQATKRDPDAPWQDEITDRPPLSPRPVRNNRGPNVIQGRELFAQAPMQQWKPNPNNESRNARLTNPPKPPPSNSRKERATDRPQRPPSDSEGRVIGISGRELSAQASKQKNRDDDSEEVIRGGGGAVSGPVTDPKGHDVVIQDRELLGNGDAHNA